MYRYINVSNLIPELQEMTDNKIINIGAVDTISQLTEDEQTALALVLYETGKTISAAMAKQLRTLSENADSGLSESDIRTLFEHKKAVHKPVQRFVSDSVVREYFKSDVSDEEFEETVRKALEMYFSQMNGNN